MEGSCHRGDQRVPVKQSGSLPRGGNGESHQNSTACAEKEERKKKTRIKTYART